MEEEVEYPIDAEFFSLELTHRYQCFTLQIGHSPYAVRTGYFMPSRTRPMDSKKRPLQKRHHYSKYLICYIVIRYPTKSYPRNIRTGVDRTCIDEQSPGTKEWACDHGESLRFDSLGSRIETEKYDCSDSSARYLAQISLMSHGKQQGDQV